MRKIKWLISIAIIGSLLLPSTAFGQSNQLNSLSINNWTFDDNQTYIYVAATNRISDARDNKNILVKINAKTLEIEDKINLGDFSYYASTKAPSDILFHNGKVYVANGDAVTVYDPNLKNVIDTIHIDLIDMSRIEIVDNMLYFMSHKQTGKNDVIDRFYKYNLVTKELTVLKNDVSGSMSYPDFKIDSKNGRVYIAETNFRVNKPSLYVLDFNTLKKMNHRYTFENMKGTGNLTLSGDTLMYGNYLLDATNIAKGKVHLSEESFLFLNKEYLVTNKGIYNLSSMKREKEFTKSSPKYLLDDNQNLFWLDYGGYVGENVSVKQTPLVPGFSDLNRFQDEINFLRNKDIIHGFTPTHFAPEQPIKRIDAIRMIIREKNEDLSTVIDPGFTDIKQGDSGFKEVAKAKELKIIDGVGNGKFAPEGHLKRSDMAKILANAYDIKGEYEQGFKDVTKDHRAFPYVSALAANNITIGYPDHTFRPDKQITRQEFAAFMARQLNKDFRAKQSEQKSAKPLIIENSGYINNFNDNQYTFTGTGTPGEKIMLTSVKSTTGDNFTNERANGYIDAEGKFSFTKDLSDLKDATYTFTFTTVDDDWKKGQEVSIQLVKDTELLPLKLSETMVTKEPYHFFDYTRDDTQVSVQFSQGDKVLTKVLTPDENGRIDEQIDLSSFEDGEITGKTIIKDIAGNYFTHTKTLHKDTKAPEKPQITKVLDLTNETKGQSILFGKGEYYSDIILTLTDGENKVSQNLGSIQDYDGLFELSLLQAQGLNDGKIAGSISLKDYYGNVSEKTTFTINKQLNN